MELHRKNTILICCLLALHGLFLAGCGSSPSTSSSSAEDSAAESTAIVEESTAGDGSTSIRTELAPAEEAQTSAPEESVPVHTRSIPVLDGPIVIPSREKVTLSPPSSPLSTPPPAASARPPIRKTNPAPRARRRAGPRDAVVITNQETAPKESATNFQEMPEESLTSENIAGARSVDLFFATDRLPTSEVIPGMFRTFLPALGVGCLCWAMLIGLSIARRFQVYWILGAAFATCLGVTVLHVCIIRWQQYSRLASSAATRFSVLRYEPELGGYPLHLGRARVSIPANHQRGQLETPSLLRFEFRESPKRHIVLQSVKVLEESEQWFDQLAAESKYATRQEAYVFIHGYNVKFGDALKSTAQLAVDLNLEGPVVCYSWPSRGRVTAYAADESSVSWSAPHLEELLLDMQRQADVRAVNVVAHSMGNRAVVQAMERMCLRLTSGEGKLLQPKPISSLVLAAPDVDAAEFKSRYLPAIEQVSDRCVLYFTSDDRALKLSSKLHAAPRLGLDFVTSNSVQAIHTGSQGLFSLSHSAYGSDVAVLNDMQDVLKQHAPPEERTHLVKRRSPSGKEFWGIDPAYVAKLKAQPMR